MESFTAGTFIGLLLGVLVYQAVSFANNDAARQECAKANNVFTCERQISWIPKETQ